MELDTWGIPDVDASPETITCVDRVGPLGRVLTTDGTRFLIV